MEEVKIHEKSKGSLKKMTPRVSDIIKITLRSVHTHVKRRGHVERL